MDTLQYWGIWPDPSLVVEKLQEKFNQNLALKNNAGLTARARELIRAYYGVSPSGIRSSFLGRTGEQGEVVSFGYNAIRPLVTSTLGLIAGQRPALKVKAKNTDSANLSDAMLADALREHAEKEYGIPQLEIDCVRGGLLAGAWGLFLSWEKARGEEVVVNPEDGRVKYEGDVACFTLPWWDYCFDSVNQSKLRKWVLFRRKANKYELAAEYTSKAEKILSGNSGKFAKGVDAFVERIIGGNTSTQSDIAALVSSAPNDDEVYLWEFRHIKSAACPQGRHILFLDGDCVLYDSQNVDGKVYNGTYEKLFAFEYAPERVVGTSFGHSGHFDLLGVQHMMDVATSSISTSLNVSGTPILWSETGSSSVASQTHGGPSYLTSPKKPEYVDAPAFKPEVVQIAAFFQQIMRESAAINEIVSGNPSKNMPAKMGAMLRATAVQYHQAAQGEYLALVADVTTGVLELYKNFGSTEKVAQIAGSASGYQVSEWAQSSQSNFIGFVPEPINPMLQSYEGRLDLGENLLAKGEISTRGFLTLMQTGTLKEPLESKEAQLVMIQKHKEMLRRGIGLPPVDPVRTQQTGQPYFIDDGQPHVILLKTDPHHIAYAEYKSVADDPVARRNPQVVTAVLDVLAETIRLWKSLTPDEIAASGGVPLPSSMMPPPGMPPQTPRGEGRQMAARDENMPKPPTDENGEAVISENLNLPPQ